MQNVDRMFKFDLLLICRKPQNKLTPAQIVFSFKDNCIVQLAFAIQLYLVWIINLALKNKSASW